MKDFILAELEVEEKGSGCSHALQSFLSPIMLSLPCLPSKVGGKQEMAVWPG